MMVISQDPTVRLRDIASTLDIINTIRHFDIIAVLTGGGPISGNPRQPVTPREIADSALEAADAIQVDQLHLSTDWPVIAA